MKQENVVICRPPASHWGFVGIAVFYAGGMAAFAYMARLPSSGPPTPAGLADFLWLISVALSLGAVIGAIWLSRMAIVAGEGGLRWRGLGRWHEIAWRRIPDYYELLPERRSRANASTLYSPLVIETTHRRIKLATDWRNVAPLRERVQQEAQQAKVRSWEIYGTRPVDSWPRTFHYRNRKDNLTRLALLSGFFTGILWGGWEFMGKTWESSGTIGWKWSLAVSAGTLALILPIVAMPALLAVLQLRTWRRRAQRITVDLSTIRFEGGSVEVVAAWEDVADYFYQATRLGLGLETKKRVVMTHKGRFDFLHTIGNAGLLEQIIKRYATQADEGAWEAREDTEALGGVHARWSGGQEGVGDRIYHYRTRTNRALLWAVRTFAVAPGLVIALNHWLGLSPRGSASMPLIVSVLIAIGTYWSGVRYRDESIRTNDSAISHVSMFRTMTIPWPEVQDYYVIGEYGGVVEGIGVRIRFGGSIVDREALKAEISRRAIHSRHSEWLRRGKTLASSEGQALLQ